MNKKMRIAITGIAPICSLGIGKEQVWDSITKLNLNIENRDVFIENELIAKYYMHCVKNKEKYTDFGNIYKFRELKEWKEQRESEDLNFMIGAVKLGIEDAHLRINDKVGLIISHENPGLEDLIGRLINETYYKREIKVKFKDYFFEIYNLIEKDSYETQSFMMLHHTAKMFDIHGFSLYINNACSSGIYALETASQAIKSGINDAMIIATSDFPKVYKQIWLEKMKLYARDGRIKSFAKNRDGFVLGEGAGVIILERYDRAVKRGARIYAEYLGGSFMLESWKVTLPALNEKYYQTTIENSLKFCKISRNEIDIINAHGLGTKVGDMYEGRAISQVFQKKAPYVTAFKPYFGHNLGGSALMETILLIIALKKQIAPPVINCEDFDDSLKINIVRNKINLKNKCFAIKLAHSFGGYIGSIILRKDKDI